MGSARLSPITTARDFAAVSEVIYQAFAGFGKPPERTDAWLRLVGRENLRAVRSGREIVSCLGVLHFGQWFGGRSVASAGVTTVAVRPEMRGAGVGSGMMRDFIRELHAGGTPLSVLYPSTKALYRKAGFEPAGLRQEYRIDAGDIGPTDRKSLQVRKLVAGDLPAVKAIYNEMARRGSGRLDRQGPQWERIVRYGLDPVYGYGAFAGKRLEAYVYYSQHGQSAGPYEIRIRDMGSRSKAGWERLLALLADHVFMAGPITFQGGPVEPLVRAAREERVTIVQRHVWMLRIVDVAKALASRGYSPTITARLGLEIDDDLIEPNRGPFVLELSGGRARVSRAVSAGRAGSRGAMLRLHIRGLASLYTGHLSAFDLRSLGLADGTEEALETASAIFAGPAPAMNDRF